MNPCSDAILHWHILPGFSWDFHVQR